MNKKGNRMKENTNGERMKSKKESVKRAMDLHRHHIHHLANENSLFHLATRGLAFPATSHIHLA